MKVGDESRPYLLGISFECGEHHVDTEGQQIQNLSDKRAGNPDCENHWLFALRLQSLFSEVG